MNKKYALLPMIAILAGCSSAPPISTEIPITRNSDEPDYRVRERSPNPAPQWAKDFSKFKRENESKGSSFFLGESGDVSDRIAGCDLSDLEAKKKVAQQIATLISDKIAATKAGQLVIDKDNPQDPGMRKHFEDVIAGKSMAFLSGAKEYGQYWEERDYSQGGGKKRVYTCMTIIEIGDKDLQAALRRAANKTEQVVEDTEAKAVVKEALKDIDSQFRNYASTPKTN